MSGSRHAPDTIARVNRSMLDGLGQLAAYFGFPAVMGRLYGTLLLSPEPLSLDDLAERLGISKGNVSMNMQTLGRLGSVREVWVKGDPHRKRRKYYEAESDLWKIVTAVLQGRERREVELALRVLGENIEQLRSGRGDMAADDQRLADFYLERIADMQALFRFAQLALESVVGQSDAPDIDAVARIRMSSGAGRVDEHG